MALTALAFAAFYACGLLAALRYPIVGLYTYVSVFYLHPPDRWWGHSLPDLRWSLLAALVTFVSLLVNRARRPGPTWFSHTSTKVLVCYTVWMTIQTLWAVEYDRHMMGVELFWKYVILTYLIYNIIDTREKLNGFMLAHVLGCFYLGYLAFTANVAGRLEGVGGPGIDDANSLSMHMSTGALAAGMMLFLAPTVHKWLHIAALPFILNTVILSISRGGLLGLVAGGLVAGYAVPRRYRPRFAILGLLGIVLFVNLTHDQFWERMGSFAAAVVGEEQELDNSAAIRIRLVDAQWEMFFDHPLGAGHDGTTSLSRHYVAREDLTGWGLRSSHSTFMSVIVDQGIPGIIMFVILMLWVAKVLFTRRRAADPETAKLYAATITGMLVIAAVAGFFTNYLKAEVQIWCIALLTVCVRLFPVESRRRASVPALRPSMSQ